MNTQNTFTNEIIFKNTEFFDLPIIFDCGQSFRFAEKIRNNISGFEGVAGNLFIRAEKHKNDIKIIYNGNNINPVFFIKNFFDMNTNYSKARESILQASSFNPQIYNVTKHALQIGKGIRILNQDPWETLITFITSQNNNIPRIRSLIDKLCITCGTPFFNPFNEIVYTFPQPQNIIELGENGLKNLKFGFRSDYIFSCANKIATGEFDLQKINAMSDLDAEQKLMTLRGVGPKVANCVLLFGYARKSRFPIDTWMKKTINDLFNGILPNFGDFAGLAQQYFFYAERYKKI